MDKLYYYRLEEAEEMKRSYSSWLAKKAHIGNGETAILQNIVIGPLASKKAGAKGDRYTITFEFDNGHQLSCYEFLFHNNLIHPDEKGLDSNPKQDSAA